MAHLTPEIQKKIKNVAIYLRKSRDEEDEGVDVLSKHRQRLIEFVGGKGWEYRIFEEIGSSDTIEYRKEFSKLLGEVTLGLHDAVVAVQWDRITRGETLEYGLIKKAFVDSNTLFIMPTGEYVDFSKEDIFQEFRALVSRSELINTKERMREGKIAGAKRGEWVNGAAPYGYEYIHKTKKLAPHAENREHYRFMVESYVSGMPIYEIAFELNRRGIPSPKGSHWQDGTIGRMLQNEAYLGTVIFGKSEGSAHKNKKTKPLRTKEEEEWIITKNAHEPLLSQEEYDEIQRLLSIRQKVPVKARQGAYLFSGLIYCGDCGKAMRYTRKTLKKGDSFYVVKCQTASPIGERCGNRGCDGLLIIDELKSAFERRFEQFKQEQDQERDEGAQRLKIQVEKARSEVDKYETAFSRIKRLFTLGDFTEEEYEQERSGITKKRDEAKQELRKLEARYTKVSQESGEERRKRFEYVRDNFSFDNIDENRGNELLKTIIDRITYKHMGESVKIRFEWL
ncbi:recombinase family protein [Paenibacillus sp. TRM 82003]|nr:recombinase family protein [Paenibacillus sp. TRM 82003]